MAQVQDGWKRLHLSLYLTYFVRENSVKNYRAKGQFELTFHLLSEA